MPDKMVQVLVENGGTLEFDVFIQKCQEQRVNAQLWVRAKHAGLLFTWIENGKHYISTSPQQVTP